MNTLRDHFTDNLITWLKNNNLTYKEVNVKIDKGNLSVAFNDKFCLKFYDCIGHGYGIIINVAEEYNENIHDNDDFSLTWAYKYLNIKQTASFYHRTENQYLQNLPNLIIDIKKIIPQLNRIDSIEWNKMKAWIKKEALKQFT